MMNATFKKDLYRYYGDEGESLSRRMLRPPEVRYLSLFRRANEAKNPVSRLFYTVRLRRLSYKTQIQIPARTKIGAGFYIGHTGRVIIHPDAVIGKNVNIATGVTVGMEQRGERMGAPAISDNVWIGTNAVIVGKVHIGTDVLIAPLTFVNFDVPDHSIVVGNPGKIIPKEEATKGYINNTVF